MSIYKLLTLIFTLLLCSIVHAGTVVSYQAGPSNGLTQGVTGKKAGDIISLQTDDGVVKFCDFTKQIIMTRTSILCVYNGTPQA